MKDYSSIMRQNLNNFCKGEDGISRAGFIAVSGLVALAALAAIYFGVMSNKPEKPITEPLPTAAQTATPTPEPTPTTQQPPTLEAKLVAAYNNFTKNEGSPPPGFQSGNWWYYDITIKNEGNIGVTIEKRQKSLSTVDWNKSDPEKMDILDMFGTNNIDAGASITSKTGTQWVWFNKSKYPYTLTETFFGKDENGKEVKISYSFGVISD